MARLLPIAVAEGYPMLTWILLQVPLALFPGPAPRACQLEVLPPFVIEERVLRDFDERVGQYVRLHRRLERSLPPEHTFGDLEDMSVVVDALHNAMVDARPNARAGAFFTPGVAELLSARLERLIAGSGRTPAEAVIAMKLGYVAALPKPRVNERFPAGRYVRVWPALLGVLPALPEELEYRVVGWDLVLVDIHADLVLDVLKDALPAPHHDLTREFAAPRNSSQPLQRNDV